MSMSGLTMGKPRRSKVKVMKPKNLSPQAYEDALFKNHGIKY